MANIIRFPLHAITNNPKDGYKNPEARQTVIPLPKIPVQPPHPLDEVYGEKEGDDGDDGMTPEDLHNMGMIGDGDLLKFLVMRTMSRKAWESRV